MNTTLSAPAKPGSIARWLSADPAESIRVGLDATLSLTVPRREQGGWRMLTTTYVVVRVPVGYRLSQNLPHGWKSYTVETSFGPLPEHWSCSCDDVPSRHNRPACKHCMALAQALPHIGIEV